MTEKKATTSNENSSQPDNLEDIEGIGEKTEKRLNNAGIETYAQLGTMSHDELWEIVEGKIPCLKREEFIESDWPGQARRLEKAKKAAPHEFQSEDTPASHRPPYETFKLDLKLTKDRIVRGTEVTHVRTEEKCSCAGWDEKCVTQFIVEQADFRMRPPEPAPPPEPTPVETELTPELEIIQVAARAKDALTWTNTVYAGQDWDIHIEWMLSNVRTEKLAGDWLIQSHLRSAHSEKKYSLPVDGPARMVANRYITEDESLCACRYAHDIHVDADIAPPGLYSCVTVVRLEKRDSTGPNLMDFHEGIPIYVYQQPEPVTVA
jgi:hypothetical protein